MATLRKKLEVSQNDIQYIRIQDAKNRINGTNIQSAQALIPAWPPTTLKRTQEIIPAFFYRYVSVLRIRTADFTGSFNLLWLLTDIS